MNYQLFHGDCLPYMRSMQDNSVDAVVTDPPYGTKKVSWDESIDPLIFSECLRVSRGYCTFFYSNTRLWHILGVLHELGAECWVASWHKNNAMGFERKFAPLWVPIVITYKKTCGFFGQDLISKPIITSDNTTGHPTPKPVSVVEWIIKKVSKDGETIFDPFLGSGTTGIACAQTGRNFIGCEIDANYFEIAQRRIKEATAQPTLEGVA